MNNASIFSQLPNDLIMNIVKMNADNQREDRQYHRGSFHCVLEDIDDVGELCLSDDEGNIGEITASQFILNLWIRKRLEEQTKARVWRHYQEGGYQGHDYANSDEDYSSESEDDDY